MPTTDSLQIIANATENVSETLGKMTAAAGALQTGLDQVSDEMDEISRAATTMSAASQGGSAAMTQLGAAGHTGASGMDEAGDESAEAAAQMAAATAAAEALSIEMGSLSFNFGAFTVALRNLATQVPILTATIGTLIAVIGGLAAVAVTAGIALGGIIGAGAIAMAQSLKEQYSDINNMMESMEVMMNSLRDVFLDALDPLMNEEAIQFFMDAVEWTASAVNTTAQWINELVIQNDEFSRFLTLMNQALATNMPKLLGAMSQSIAIMGEEFANITGGLINALAEGIIWFSEVTAKLANSRIPEIINKLGDFTQTVVHLGMEIFEGLVPILLAFFEAIQAVSEALLSMGDGMVSTIALTIGLAAAMNGLAGRFATLLGPISDAASGLLRIGFQAKSAREALSILGLNVKAFAKQYLKGISRLAEATPLVSAMSLDEIGDAKSKITDTGHALSGLGERLDNLSGVSFDPRMGGASLRDMDTGQAMSPDDILGMKTYKKVKSRIMGLGDDLRAFAKGPLNSFAKGIAGPLTAAGSKASSMLNDMRKSSGGLIGELGVVKEYAYGFATSLYQTAAAALGAETGLYGYIKGAIVSRVSTLKAMYANYGIAGSLLLVMQNALAAAGGFISLGTAINVALVGIPTLLMAIAVLGGVIVGVLGNMKGAAGAASASFEWLKSGLGYLANKLLPLFITVWNTLISIVGMVVRPFMAVYQLINQLAQAFGLVSKNGSVLMMIVGALKTGFEALVQAGIWFWDILGKIATFIGDKLVGAINTLIDGLQALGMDVDNVEAAAGTIEGLKVDEEKVREGASAVEEGAGSAIDKFTGKPSPEINMKEEVNNNVEEINADPEDSEKLKRIVKDAMDEANTYRRRREGY